jgi:hypothetical protein
MPAKHRGSIGLGVAAGVVALTLGGLPLTLDTHSASLSMNAALADAGGNGKGRGGAMGNGNGKGIGAEQSQQAKAAHAKSHIAKDDPMHPSNLGRLNGFLNASPQALKNTSENSAIGILSKTYRDALLGYATSSEESEEGEETVSTEDLAAILAKAANKPLTGEQVLAIHEKLITENPELAEAVAGEEGETDEVSKTVDLMDPDFADQLAEEANAIQKNETNQGLGTDDVADSNESEDGDGFVAEAAQTVADAAVNTANAIGDFFDENF